MRHRQSRHGRLSVAYHVPRGRPTAFFSPVVQLDTQTSEDDENGGNGNGSEAQRPAEGRPFPVPKPAASGRPERSSGRAAHTDHDPLYEHLWCRRNHHVTRQGRVPPAVRGGEAQRFSDHRVPHSQGTEARQAPADARCEGNVVVWRRRSLARLATS